MKISYNWLKDYLEIDMPAEKVGEILTEIGLEVEGIEEVQPVPGGLKGLVIGEVVECGKHPNADRLSLTKVNLGHGEIVQIVCGAPNVAKGQKVVVATVGAELFPTGGDSFKIKKGKIRGEISEGMICAEDEIGLGTSHEGIMVLTGDTPIGLPAAEHFGLKSDYVFEIGLTPNRSDATHHRGVAKDLYAALAVNYGYDKPFDFGDDPIRIESDGSANVEVVVHNHEACPRYSGIVIKNLKIGPSPEWLKDKLSSIGVKSINNIVDITNYILHDMGQPLHAFDWEQIKGGVVNVRTLEANTEFDALDQRKFKLAETDLMICDGDNNPMCIGGVFGGIQSGVKDSTTSIFLESAHFDAEWIRRSSVRHNLRTDAAKVFEKGSDPNMTVKALKRATQLLVDLAAGQVASEIIDIYPHPIEKKKIEINADHVAKLIGEPIQMDEIKIILEKLDIDILSEKENTLEVAIPTDKVDVTREADVIEEILRIYGFNKIPLNGKISFSISRQTGIDEYELKEKVSRYLISNGFLESMSLSIITDRYVPHFIEEDQLVKINNTSNLNLEILRPTLLSSFIQTIEYNKNRQQSDFALFEFGQSYVKNKSEYSENSLLGILISGDVIAKNWNQKEEKADFYHLKAIVNNILEMLGVSRFNTSEVDHPNFEYGLQYIQGNLELVNFGLVKNSEYKDLEEPLFYSEFNWANVVQASSRAKVQIEKRSKFPSVSRDLALLVPPQVQYADIDRIVRNSGKKLLKDVYLFDIYENEKQLGEGFKSYAIHLKFEDLEKTLNDKQIDSIIDAILKQLNSQLNVKLR